MDNINSEDININYKSTKEEIANFFDIKFYIREDAKKDLLKKIFLVKFYQKLMKAI